MNDRFGQLAAVYYNSLGKIWGYEMNLSDLGVIAEIIGALSIIITLVYLAIQVRQNTA